MSRQSMLSGSPIGSWRGRPVLSAAFAFGSFALNGDGDGDALRCVALTIGHNRRKSERNGRAGWQVNEI